MRQLIVLFFLLFLTGIVKESAASDGIPGSGYTIKGKIKGVNSGMVRLQASLEENRGYRTVDSAVITKGAFLLTGVVNGPQMMRLAIDPGNWTMEVFVENVPLIITADTTGAGRLDHPSANEVKGSIIKRFTEMGSGEYDALIVFRNDPRERQLNKLIEQYTVKMVASANDEGKYKLRGMIDSVNREKLGDQKKHIDIYADKHPSSVIGTYLLHEWFHAMYRDVPPADLETPLGRFTGKAKESRYYIYLEKKLNLQKAVLPGKVAPDFTLSEKDGAKFTLSSARGKYLLVDFWASWCVFCRQGIPHWKEMYKKYQKEGFEVLSLSLDRARADWLKAMDAEQMPWTQVIDDYPVKINSGRVAELYSISSIPCYLLLDKDGRILVYEVGATEQIDAKLKELFEK